MKIANHEVTSITKETAQVGCTEVTLAEAEALVEAMKTAKPPRPDFELVSENTSNAYVKFMLYTKFSGYVAAAQKARVPYENIAGYSSSGFDTRSIAFCLRREQAEAFYQFLKKELGY